MEEIIYNNWPKGKQPKTLKKGETVVFELANLKPDPCSKTGELARPFVQGVPGSCTIFLPEEEEFINIAHITGRNMDGSPKIESILFKKAQSSAVTCTGGTKKGQSMYEYLSNCVYNEDSPYRVGDEPVYVKEVNYTKILKETRAKRDLKNEAQNKAKGLTLNEARQVCIGLGLGEKVSSMNEDEIRGAVEDFADVDPESFLAKSENRDYSIMDVANTAKSKGLLKYDLQKREISTPSGVLTSWPPEKDVDWLDKFVKYVKTDEGSKFFKELKEDLKVKK